MEFRGQGFQSNYFYIYEFLGEAQDAAAAREEGTRQKRATAGLDELELEPWVSLWSNHFGDESTAPLAWTEGNKMPPQRRLEGGEQGMYRYNDMQYIMKELKLYDSAENS